MFRTKVTAFLSFFKICLKPSFRHLLNFSVISMILRVKFCVKCYLNKFKHLWSSVSSLQKKNSKWRQLSYSWGTIQKYQGTRLLSTALIKKYKRLLHYRTRQFNICVVIIFNIWRQKVQNRKWGYLNKNILSSLSTKKHCSYGRERQWNNELFSFTVGLLIRG